MSRNVHLPGQVAAVFPVFRRLLTTVAMETCSESSDGGAAGADLGSDSLRVFSVDSCSSFHP